jgi:hypothetical protein
MKFKKDINSLFEKLKDKEHFAFTRYSDGEVLVMQNKRLILAKDYVITDKQYHNFGYSDDDYKNFDPGRHGFVKEALLKSYKFKKKNYFVGGICKNCNCASQQYVSWMREQYGEFDEHYTYANLLVNSNYPEFIEKWVPELANHKVVMVCSKNATFDSLPFDIVKDFRVGTNCIANDHHLIEEMSCWIEDNDIQDHVFLFSASSLSEILIHNLFDKYDNNTYIDIGTTLHKYLGLSLQRGYLQGYWNKIPHPSLETSCND